MSRRKRRKGEYVCRCGAYKFPHRMMGGRCNGGALVDDTFNTQMYGACRDCMLREEIEDFAGPAIKCQVLEGREELQECPALQEFIQYHEIIIHGVNKR
jgi:hypothetical protein